MIESGDAGWGGKYDTDSNSAHYLSSDGIHAVRYTVTEITEAEAFSIAAELDVLAEWPAQAIHDAVNRVLPTDFKRVQ